MYKVSRKSFGFGVMVIMAFFAHGQAQAQSYTRADYANFCASEAISRVPANILTEKRPVPVYRTVQNGTICTSKRNYLGHIVTECKPREETVYGTEYRDFSYDANLDMRNRYIAQCVHKKCLQGYGNDTCTYVNNSEKYARRKPKSPNVQKLPYEDARTILDPIFGAEWIYAPIGYIRYGPETCGFGKWNGFPIEEIDMVKYSRSNSMLSVFASHGNFPCGNLEYNVIISLADSQLRDVEHALFSIGAHIKVRK